MTEFEKAEKVFKALGSASRIHILDMIRNGTSNPGEISRRLHRDRSTVEKHLRVLLAAGIVQKVPSLKVDGRLTIGYSVRSEMKSLLELVQTISDKV